MKKILIILIGLACFSGCSPKKPIFNTKYPDHVYHKLSAEDQENKDYYKGDYKVGSEYEIKGQSYKPKIVKKYIKTGVASWYGSRYGFHGKKTANGDKYNKELLTAAHKTLPLPSLVKVHNLENGKSLIVMVNDRGPFAKNREIDVSEKAAALLGFKRQGTAKVKVQYLYDETEEFLKEIGIKKHKNNKKASKMQMANNKCTINCHIKIVNMKRTKGYKFDT